MANTDLGQAHGLEQLMTVKIDAMVGEIPQTFEYGNLFAREDVGGHARLRVGLMRPRTPAY